MPSFCDVALPVPLDRNFTYAAGELQPVVGARVLVPFSGQRLMGVVVRVHDEPLPEGVEAKPVQAVLDETALVPDELMRLAGWIAQYYVAPLGEVLRGMLPLTAEVRRRFVYRIGEAGRRVLYDGAAKGASRRTRLTPEEQNREYAVLNYLEAGETARASAIRSATGAGKGLLDGMVKKKWVVREAEAEERDARRVEKVVVLVEGAGAAFGAPLVTDTVLGSVDTTHCGETMPGEDTGKQQRNTGVLHFVQDDGVKQTTAETKRNTEVFHFVQDDGVKQTTAETKRHTGVFHFVQDDGVKQTTAETKRNTGVLHFVQDDGVKQTTEETKALAEEGKIAATLQDDGVKETTAETRAIAEEVKIAAAAKTQVALGAGRLPRLNENQLAVMAELAAVGGRMAWRGLREALGRLGVPESTVGTLVRRGLVRVEEVAASFDMGGVGVAGKKNAHEHALNETQMEALSALAVALEKGRFAPHLLYGVTGSGKTAVYVAAMQRVLAAGKSALMLVPEIGLTPAMTGQMVAAFGGEVALMHSGLTPDERAEQWHRIRRGEARVVVGTRSAVFAPLRDLGLLIVDEEHDQSYKQEETPRYHGRDVAVMRAKLNDAVVVLGSATPSLESWANAERGRYARVEMLGRVMDRPLPAVELVDMRAEFQAMGKDELFSRRLLEETRATLDRGEQAIVLLNRRGYSFVVMCRSCGEKIECENCAISMTYHKAVESGDERARVGERLECHYCGFRRNIPKVCPKCGSEHLYYLGAGSQQGEERLQELFPGARIGRMDRDTVRGRNDMERLLGRLHGGEINLLVGTQMIAKGHDIHGVTLVGVVGADHALGLPDFRAAERVFQLLTQVSGRAGRGELPGKVVVQTYHPDHYAIQFAAKHDYVGFVGKEMNYRRWMHYPPFAVLANVVVQSEKLEEATGWAGVLGRWFERTPMEKVRVLGPAAAPIVRLKRIYRYHFVLKAEKRSVLGETLRAMLAAAEREGIPRKSLVVDVDAVSMM